MSESSEKNISHWPSEILTSDFDPDKIIEETQEIQFHVGQSYTKTVAKALKCRLCGSTKFYVGRDYCFTAIKCIECKWEFCIHDG